MIKHLLVCFYLGMGSEAICQVSVYSCQAYETDVVTPTDLGTSGTTFYQSCITIDKGDLYGFSGAYQKDIRATEYIRLTEATPFWAGEFGSGAGMTLSMIEKSTFDVAVMNYPNLSNVEKYKKLEFGVELPSPIDQFVENFITKSPVGEDEQINPFLDWKLDVEAEFTDPYGNKKIVDAFYYVEYDRDEAANSWAKIHTDYPVRIRFSPPTPGMWYCTVTIKRENEVVATSVPFHFKVIESDAHGYVSVHQNNRNLELGGQMIFPVGLNLPSPTRGVLNSHSGAYGESDVWHPEDHHKVTTLQNWLDYHDDVQTYNEMGGRYIRTIQSGWSTLLEFEEKGNYYDRQPYAWEQDRLLEYCEAHNMLVHFDFMQQEPLMKYGNYDLYDWDWSHYNADGTYFDGDIFQSYCYADDDPNKEPYQPGKQPHEMFTHDDDLRYHEQRTRYYISRYGYSTSIYLFELLSESFHLDQLSNQIVGNGSPDAAIAEEAIVNYQSRISTYIKNTLGHSEHLIAVNVIDIRDQSIHLPNVDVITLNRYGNVPEKLIIAKSLTSAHPSRIETYPGENSYYREFNDIFQQTNKPIMIAEGGPGDEVDQCSDFTQFKIDMMSFGFTGLAGFYNWVGFDNGQRHMWPMIIRSQQHMNGQDVISTLSAVSGFWNQGREKSTNELKEHQYYLSENQEKAVGYIRNRTYNIQTMSNSDPESKCATASFNTIYSDLINLTEDNGVLKIDGLKQNTDYIIHWYDFETGYYMDGFSECFTTGLFNSTEKLNHPILDVRTSTLGDNLTRSAVLWYVIYQYDCNQNLAQSFSEQQQFDSITPFLGGGEVFGTSAVKIEPNPFNDEIRIVTNNEIGEIVLFNNLMQEVVRTSFKTNEASIPTSNLSPGIYFILLPDQNYQLKMIKL